MFLASKEKRPFAGAVMSVGSKIVGTMPNKSQRTWSGNDGRFEVVDGFARDKWNTYTSESWAHSGNFDSKYGLNFITVDANTGQYFEPNDTIKLYAKLASAVRAHDFHLGKFIGEGKETVGLVVDTIHNVGGALVDLKRGNFQKAARRLGVNKGRSSLNINDISGRWLELQFGWKPLLQDVHEAMKAYEKLTSGPRVELIRVGTSRKGVYNGSASPSNWSGAGAYKLSQRLIFELREEPSQQRLLGLEDPAGIAWELTPYSFVLDWFIPIGTYLEVLNIVPKLRGRWVKTQARKLVCRGNGYDKWPSNLYYKNTWASFDYTHISRTVGSGFSALNVPLPNFKPVSAALSSSHVKNALALASQALYRA